MFSTDSIRGRRNTCFANSLDYMARICFCFWVEKMKATPNTELIPGLGKGLFFHQVSTESVLSVDPGYFKMGLSCIPGHNGTQFRT